MNLECSSSAFGDHGDFVVHQYASGADTFYTNAFVVETSCSLVIIDTMMTVSQARGLRGLAETLGKPVVAVLITHPHPDHYNGAGQFQGDSGAATPVITSAAVNAAIQAGVDSKELKWRPVFGSEWPQEKFKADRFMTSGQVLRVDGVGFELWELGKGESATDTCWLVGAGKRAVFVGDVVFNDTHSFLSDGYSLAWLDMLTVLERRLRPTDRLYLGHGQPGEPGVLIPRQRRYLQDVRHHVQRLANGKPTLDEESKQALAQKMSDLHGTEKLAGFVMAGADALARELAGEPAMRRPWSRT